MEDFFRVKNIANCDGSLHEKREDFFFSQDSFLDPDRDFKERKKRVLFFVLKEIQKNPKCPASLLANIKSPKAFLDLLSSRAKKTIPKVLVKKERQIAFFEEKLIGIDSPQYGEWICSFLQFVFFIPSFYEMFPFLPSSLAPLLDCSIAYKKAKEEGRNLEVHYAKLALEVIRKKVMPIQKGKGINFYFLLQTIMQRIGGNRGFFPFSPSFSLYLTEKNEVSRLFSLEEEAEELLVGLKPHLLEGVPFETLFSIGKGLNLLSFVEYRTDRVEERGIYITYLFSSQTWYQCYQGRVISVKKENLFLALQGAVLLYYQK